MQLALAYSSEDPADRKDFARPARTRAVNRVCQGHLWGTTACEKTERVTLIPVDEWLDDTKNNPWLPSFVLPRDPAILKIINASRRYLIGIGDDPAAGFDGYQQEDPVPSTSRCRRSGPLS